jgi:hypothetical protein
VRVESVTFMVFDAKHIARERQEEEAATNYQRQPEEEVHKY